MQQDGGDDGDEYILNASIYHLKLTYKTLFFPLCEKSGQRPNY